MNSYRDDRKLSVREIDNILNLRTQYDHDYDEVSKIETDLGPIWLTGMRSESRFLEIQEIIHFDCVISFTDKFHVDLSKHGITHIACDIDDIEDPEEAEKFKKILEPFYTFMDKRLKDNKKVLIHCAAGVSRSVTAMIAYLMYRDHINDEKSTLIGYILYLKHCRDFIHPNNEFLKMLDNLY